MFDILEIEIVTPFKMKYHKPLQKQNVLETFSLISLFPYETLILRFVSLCMYIW
jgi:hypothetical protein